MYKKIVRLLLFLVILGGFIPSTVNSEMITIKKVPHILSERKVKSGSVQMVSIDLKNIVPQNIHKKSGSNKNVSGTVTSKDMVKGQKRIYQGPDIRVGLLVGQQEVTVKVLNSLQIKSDKKRFGVYQRGEILTINRAAKGVQINKKSFPSTVYLEPTTMEPSFSLKGQVYRGLLKIRPSTIEGKVNIINVVPLEIYLQGVIPCEVIPSWAMDAIKAQAVAARTYAMYHKNGYEAAGYDVTDDIRSQVYRGYSAETGSTNRAVQQTKGEILTYQGKVIDALFHANGGGYTENSENVWGTYIPYLRGVKEERSKEVNNVWNKTISLATFIKSLANNGYNVGQIKGITLSHLSVGNNKSKDRGVSGRVKYIVIIGNKGEKRITGNDIQSIFGLKSTLFDISIKGKDLIFTGYGFGHGLGLSQWGAEALASKYGNGKDYYKKILSHYFVETKIEKIY